ncbi:protein of unknown function [Azospirillum baldaniorum]|uniref:Uncharacterized protein n=1 Tax=Azospirillum baldaniorum TaxID=1064539 RepID=A0A9P1NKY0_9PROT|nr:protein of unknown function [Azospirillum baldaniorum]
MRGGLLPPPTRFAGPSLPRYAGEGDFAKRRQSPPLRSGGGSGWGQVRPAATTAARRRNR